VSYILDALKRSEQERRRIEAPAGEVAPATAPAANRSGLTIFALVIVVANIALLSWHFWFRDPPRQPAPAPAPAASAPAVTATPLPPSPQPSLAAASGSEQQAPVAPLTAVTPPPPTPARATTLAPTEPAPAATPAAAVPVATDLPPPLTALPESFRRQLPPINVNVHVYADQPAGRFVLVDMQRFKEGSQLPNGMRLQRITPNGLVLEYQGQQFLMVVR